MKLDILHRFEDLFIQSDRRRRCRHAEHCAEDALLSARPRVFMRLRRATVISSRHFLRTFPIAFQFQRSALRRDGGP